MKTLTGNTLPLQAVSLVLLYDITIDLRILAFDSSDPKYCTEIQKFFSLASDYEFARILRDFCLRAHNSLRSLAVTLCYRRHRAHLWIA